MGVYDAPMSEYDLPTGEDEADADSVPALPLTPADLAAMGATVGEIAATLRISPREAAIGAGPITQAQLDRLEQVMHDRSIGTAEVLPHVQAGQFMLSNHRPLQYGKGQAGVTTQLRVVVDRTWTKRNVGSVTEGQVVQVLAPPPPRP